MSTAPDDVVSEENTASPRLALLLSAAMFVLVVDTSLMNVSISAVIKDLHTTASGVQSAIALEALVSAAFILINSKMGDLMGASVLRHRPTRLCRRCLGHDRCAEPDCHHHLLGDHRRARRVPAPTGHAVPHPRQFRGRRAEAAFALTGASAAIAAAVGPLLGGFAHAAVVKTSGSRPGAYISVALVLEASLVASVR